MGKHLLILFGIGVFLSGCANLNSIARDFNINEGQGKLIDAKQRAIIVHQRPETNQTVVCAEPSPDALSAYAMQLALEGNIPNNVAGKIATSLQEGTSFTGLRTQSIQLLRDGMFRNCEAYANGAIDKDEYATESRRYQRNMIALLAIEQLTGAIRVPPIAITTEGNVELGKSLNDLQMQSDALQQKIDEIKKEISDTDINDTKKGVLESQVANWEQNKKAIDSAIVNSRDILTNGKSQISINEKSLDPNRSDAHIQAVADTVYRIFKDLNGADDFEALCLTYLINYENTGKMKSSNIAKVCEQRLEIKNKYFEASINVNKNIVDVSNHYLSSSQAQQTKAGISQALKNLNDAGSNLLNLQGLKAAKDMGVAKARNILNDQ
ncbi:MAG: hypothetical protein PHW64_00425 [Sulfuricurvum sp.]|nr:hypothetical protein [Sulfuricurvum sp.]